MHLENNKKTNKNKTISMIQYIEYNKNNYSKSTDFKHLIQDKHSLLIYAENFETYLEILEAVKSNSKLPGPTAGTACIRGEPNAIPIVTGYNNKGFTELDQIIQIGNDFYKVKDIIDNCFDGLKLCLKSNSNVFKRLIYSAQPGTQGQWGWSIFQPSQIILNYINNKIDSLRKDQEFLSYFKKEVTDIYQKDGFVVYYTLNRAI